MICTKDKDNGVLSYHSDVASSFCLRDACILVMIFIIVQIDNPIDNTVLIPCLFNFILRINVSVVYKMCLKNVSIRCVPIAIAGGGDINAVVVVDDADVANARFGFVILCSNRNMNDNAAGIVVFLCNDDEVLRLGNRDEDLFMSLSLLPIMRESLFDIRLCILIG